MSTISYNILQLIDSLDAGGGEKMAVQIANQLSFRINLSALVCTRHSGILQKELEASIFFKSLQKKNSLDLKAILHLRAIVKSKQIDIIHAHSTSFFMASIIKIFCPRVKIVWHDHYGLSELLENRPKRVLQFCSFFFSQIIAVNKQLKKWSEKYLYCKSITYLQNFSIPQPVNMETNYTLLKGKSTSLKIIHVANIRPQKDHITALKSIKILIEKGVDISYHIIGDYQEESEYYLSLLKLISNNNLHKNVFLYGKQSNVIPYLQEADIGMLSSISEGLPVSLLEYGFAKLPVIVTDVGQCKDLVGRYGVVVEPHNPKDLAKGIINIINNLHEAREQAKKLNLKIKEEYSANKVVDKLILLYSNIMD